MTPETRLTPGDGSPPLINPPQPLLPRAQPGRQLIVGLLNLCLALFLVDALLSFADDTLLNVLNVRLLSGLRGILGTLSLLISLIVYVLLGFVRVIPKRLFVPISLFNLVTLLLMLPVGIYFFSRVQQASWIFSLLQLCLGLLVLWYSNRGFKIGWPLLPAPLTQGRLFSWLNLFLFCGVNLCLVLPAIVAYLALCSALAVGHYSDGFVALRPSGFTVHVKKYVRNDGKSILLVPMSHIGEPEFYRTLSRSFPTNSTILMEGVTDDKNLLTNRITYKRMANSLGLAQQQKEFKPSPLQMVMADIDVDQFSPKTIGFLNLVMLIHSKGLTLENVLLVMQTSDSPEFGEQIFNDILNKRNQHLVQEITEHLPASDQLIVPWGAAHMPGIAREIQKFGFRLESSREFTAISFHHRNGPASRIPPRPDTGDDQ